MAAKYNSRSQLAEDARAANVARALVVRLAHIALHALILGRPVGAHVRLHHGNAGHGRIADRVLFADRPGDHRAVRERRLQGVQQTHHDRNELYAITKNASLIELFFFNN